MYSPEAFQVRETATLHEWIRQHSFGTLVTRLDRELCATHLPFLLDGARGEHGALVCHMARANPQWKGLEREPDALAIFQGPHAYVSPSWYVGEKNVPTWNYVAVHVYGTARLIHDPEELLPLVDALVRHYEAGLREPWSLERTSADYVRHLLGGIVGMEITITRLEGKAKLGQNKGEDDRIGVIAALEALDDPNSVAVARLMRERKS